MFSLGWGRGALVPTLLRPAYPFEKRAPPGHRGAGHDRHEELTDALPVTQPAVSQHLKMLKHVGLVSDRAEGTKRIYRLNEAGVAALRDQLEAFWKRTMSGFEDLMKEDR